MIEYSDINFDYETENREVRLVKYPGSNKDTIIPSFITALAKNAFRFTGIKKINLNEGLKIIGNSAFIKVHTDNALESVEIPSTVQLISAGAFYGNDKLIRYAYGFNANSIKLRNDKTIVLNQNTWERSGK